MLSKQSGLMHDGGAIIPRPRSLFAERRRIRADANAKHLRCDVQKVQLTTPSQNEDQEQQRRRYAEQPRNDVPNCSLFLLTQPFVPTLHKSSRSRCRKTSAGGIEELKRDG